MADPFLVLAHHRSGSNFMNDLVQAHPCADCINEPFSMHTPFFRDCDLVPWSAAEFDPYWLHRSLMAHGALRDFMLELRRLLLNSHPRRVLGLKETGLFGKLGWLKAFLPALRVVFVKRDPRAIVSSVLRSGLIDVWRYRERVPPAFRAACPGYESTAGPGERDAELAAMSVAVRWRSADAALGAFVHRVVWLERFVAEPADHLRGICDFLSLQPHPAQAAFLAERQRVSRGGRYSSFRAAGDMHDGWRSRLSAREVAVVDDVMRAAQIDTPPV